MLKHSPKHFNDDPTVNLPTNHGRNLVAERAGSIPADSVVQLEQDLYARALWNDPKRSLRFLELSRSPTLTFYEIAQKLNLEFNETRFTQGSCSGRLDRLRAISNGFYGCDRKKRIPPR